MSKISLISKLASTSQIPGNEKNKNQKDASQNNQSDISQEEQFNTLISNCFTPQQKIMRSPVNKKEEVPQAAGTEKSANQQSSTISTDKNVLNIRQGSASDNIHRKQASIGEQQHNNVINNPLNAGASQILSAIPATVNSSTINPNQTAPVGSIEKETALSSEKNNLSRINLDYALPQTSAKQSDNVVNTPKIPVQQDSAISAHVNNEINVNTPKIPVQQDSAISALFNSATDVKGLKADQSQLLQNDHHIVTDSNTAITNPKHNSKQNNDEVGILSNTNSINEAVLPKEPAYIPGNPIIAGKQDQSQNYSAGHSGSNTSKTEITLPALSSDKMSAPGKHLVADNASSKINTSNLSLSSVDTTPRASTISYAADNQVSQNPASQFIADNNSFVAQLSQIQLLSNGTYKLNATLQPPALGKVETEFKMSNGVLTVAITSHSLAAHNNLLQNVHEIANITQTDSSNINFYFQQGEKNNANSYKGPEGQQVSENNADTDTESKLILQASYTINNSLHVVL